LKGKENFDEKEIEDFEKEGVEFVFSYKPEDFKKVDLVILSSGIKHDYFEENKINFISELDWITQFLDEKKRDYIFITGTKGKGTTSTFTKFLFDALGLKTFLGGNIGETEFSSPGSEAIFTDVDVYLFETSSFQLRSSFKARPLIHAIVNLGIDHLDWHPSLEDYWQSKLKFCDLAKYSIKPGEFEILKNAPDYFLENFPGEHNLYDLSLAYRILEIYAQDKNLKIPEDLLEKAVKNFPHQKFVLQFEGEINVNGKKVKVYNDSKSTHYLSLKASLNSFPKPVILICGGLTKGFDFEDIKDVLKEKVKFGIIIGRDKEILKKSFPQDKVFLEESLESAFNKALEIAEDQDIILFSPGCASFDMFKNATHRGEVFSEIVRKANGRE